jgi:3-(3-hydroxy-phenyl)propionate hydroxylase
MERLLRDEVLDLAEDFPFARKLVNSGRLSQPCSLAGFRLQTAPANDEGLSPGLPCPDAPVANGKAGGWLLNELGGGFSLVHFGAEAIPGLTEIPQKTVDGRPDASDLHDVKGYALRRYGAGLSYLIRPDQHIAARFVRPSANDVRAAWRRATGRSLS